MKDLDKTQVYDLRGITEEQARELLDWLVENDRGWATPESLDGYDGFYRAIQEYTSIKHTGIADWFVSVSKPTTHISTLFEKSYEQQLKEAKKQLEHYKKEVERLESESKPKVGDVCKFWDFDEGVFILSELVQISEDSSPYLSWGDSYRNARRLTEQEVIDLLFKKS